MRLENELDAGLRFGVRVEAPGRVLVDFHTITDFLPMADGKHKYQGGTSGKALAKIYADPDATPATIISPRAYLEDAAFLVGLEETDGYSGLLARCAAALQRPVWPLYLGRKACIPTRPILELLTDEYGCLDDALARHHGHGSEWECNYASVLKRISTPISKIGTAHCCGKTPCASIPHGNMASGTSGACNPPRARPGRRQNHDLSFATRAQSQLTACAHGVGNAYEMHRTLSRAFGDGQSAYEDARCLFRVDVAHTYTMALVQSLVEPVWSDQLPRESYLLQAPRVKPLDWQATPGQLLRFRLRANPTKRVVFARRGRTCR